MSVAGVIEHTLFRPLLAIFIVILAGVIAQIVSNRMRRRQEKMSKREHKLVDKTKYVFMRHMAKAVIYLAGIAIAIYMIPDLRQFAVGMFAGAGILAIVVGFASQAAFSNIVSGIFITIFKPFRIGDIIHVGTIEGTVEDITLRHTVIRDFENVHHVIPNSIISDQSIENRSLIDERVRKHIVFSISYESSIDKAMKIIQEEALKHPLTLDGRTVKEKQDKAPVVPVKVIKLGDFSVDIRAWVWAKNPTDAFIIKCDLLKSVKERFDKNRIEIPYPHRTIVQKRK